MSRVRRWGQRRRWPCRPGCSGAVPALTLALAQTVALTVALALALAVAVAVAVAGPAAAAGGQPGQLSLDPDEVAVGDRVTVQLAGWPAGNVVVELCGNDAARGAADCAVASSGQTYVGQDGTGLVQLPVGQPPVACPCVVRARDPAGTTLVTHPIEVAGVTTPPAADPARPGTLRVSEVGISGGWSWPALFGGPAPRTVTFTLHHSGDAPLVDPPFSLLVGRGEHPTTLVAAPALDPIGPGRSATYQVPVSLPAPAYGHYTVRGEVAGAAFLAETTSYPWGLTGLLAMLAAAAGLVVLRRRRAARLPAGGAGGG